MRRTLAIAIAPALVCSFAACAYDWGGFAQDDAAVQAGTDASTQVDGAVTLPDKDAASEDDAAIAPGDDANVPVDAGVDAPLPCLPATACTGTGKACGIACGTTGAQCLAACSNNGCRNQCRNAETACRNNCAGQCSTCTQAAGCPSPGPCDAAAMAD